MKKRTLIFAVVLAIITGFSQTAYLTAKAADVTFAPSIIDETIGVVDEIYMGKLHISGEPLTPGGLERTMIELGDAPIYDLLTGLTVPIHDIKIGMEVRAAYWQSKELPQAVTVWLNPNHDDAAVFTAVVSENIQYGPDYCVFLSADGRYRITLTADTYIYEPGYGEITARDIFPGQEFFIWVDMITASSPALVYPDKVVLIE